jgi:thiamine-monophosphate kinase
MGAVPVGAVVAASLPRDFGEDRAMKLFEAMRSVAGEYGCPLFGGDVSIWEGRLLLSVTVLARPTPGTKPILRQGARAGDIICVTGALGGSLEEVQGVIHHLDFEPRLAMGQRLAREAELRPRAMIDLSDGLARDIHHLLEQPLDKRGGHQLGARIDLHRLPVSAGARQAAKRDGVSVWEHALCDGEDYELCFAVAPEKSAAVMKLASDVPIAIVGQFTDSPGVVFLDEHGHPHTFQRSGWEHQGQ